MAIHWLQALEVGKYLVSKRLKGDKQFPLVLMLEPLFRCNLACTGCGKIQHPPEILKQNQTARAVCDDDIDVSVAVEVPGFSVSAGHGTPVDAQGRSELGFGDRGEGDRAQGWQVAEELHRV